MARIWAKAIIDGKIVKQYTYTLPSKLVYSKLYDYCLEICGKLDLPTPIVIKPHIFNFAKFSLVRFKAADFVEAFDYDSLTFEYIN